MKGQIGFVSAVAAVALAGGAYGQGTIMDGNAVFTYSASGTPGLCDYMPDGGVDHAYQVWWWTRAVGEPQEYSLPYPAPFESYIGNTAVQEWYGLGPGYDVRLTTVLKDTAVPNVATLTQALTVSNPTAAAIDVSVFSYADCDVSDTFSDEFADLVGPGQIGIEDVITGDKVGYAGQGSDHYHVDAYSLVRDLLDNAVADTLPDCCVPFGPDDFTGAYQWEVITVPAGGSRTVVASLGSGGHMEPTPVVVVNGTCPGPVEVLMVGMTPGAPGALVYSLSPGPWVVPGGPCAGTTLDVAPPFLPGAPVRFTADSRGHFLVRGTVPPALCGRLLLQAIDVSRCMTSNVVLVN